jgi:hypothetical protein
MVAHLNFLTHLLALLETTQTAVQQAVRFSKFYIEFLEFTQ